MERIQIFLKIIFGIEYFFVCLLPIKKNRVTFITLESETLEDDLKLIHQALDSSKCERKIVAFRYDAKTLKNNILYLFNCLKQVYYINTSHMVLLRDNNFVVSHFKRKGVIVTQLWHATGAVKKFGNAIQRKYPIANYDYVIANHPVWKTPYHLAFGVEEDHVLDLGMPRIDTLLNEEKEGKERVYQAFPELKGKRIVLYAPTFRGNIYDGFHPLPIDLDKVIERLDNDTYIVFKYHPLLKKIPTFKSKRIINANHMNTYDLFHVSDVLISDYSSIIFDYMLLNRPIIYYIPDLETYKQDLGLFIDVNALPGYQCDSEIALADLLNSELTADPKAGEAYFTYRDGNNTLRVAKWIEEQLRKGESHE